MDLAGQVDRAAEYLLPFLPTEVAPLLICEQDPEDTLLDQVKKSSLSMQKFIDKVDRFNIAQRKLVEALTVFELTCAHLRESRTGCPPGQKRIRHEEEGASASFIWPHAASS